MLGNRMQDKQVNLGCVIAAALWIVTALLIAAASLTFDVSPHLSLMLATCSLAFSAASATATIRRYFVKQNELMRNAFEFGREAASVTQFPRAR